MAPIFININNRNLNDNKQDRMNDEYRMMNKGKYFGTKRKLMN